LKIVRNPKELQELVKSCLNIGLVPTMGALHEGHVSLIKKAREQNKIVVVSIFVNPTQFLPNEDLSKYPRNEKKDTKICQDLGVDFVFLPTAENMYEKNEPLVKADDQKGLILEGKTRPGHFNGVLSIILKLINIVRPDKIYFGKKDTQQLILVKQMIRAYFLQTQVVPCEIIRDENGLALSSRNVYLNTEQKQTALTISKGLFAAKKAFLAGEKSTQKLKQIVESFLKQTEIDYVEIVNQDLKAQKTAKTNESIILVATKVGSTRLIDNIWL